MIKIPLDKAIYMVVGRDKLVIFPFADYCVTDLVDFVKSLCPLV